MALYCFHCVHAAGNIPRQIKGTNKKLFSLCDSQMRLRGLTSRTGSVFHSLSLGKGLSRERNSEHGDQNLAVACMGADRACRSTNQRKQKTKKQSASLLFFLWPVS